MLWFFLISLLLFAWAFALLVLDGPNLDYLDSDVEALGVERFPAHADDALAQQQFLSEIRAVRSAAAGTKSIKKGLALVREFADNLSADLQSDCEFISVVADGVSCEWAIAPGADPKRRVIFLHGGAFLMGSPRGHRKYAHQLSHLAQAAVLSVDYRMLPEHRRIISSHDAQAAYRWLLANGPDGASAPNWLLTAGDSAGGNLALMLSGWSKDIGLRKPDGVIAFSPNTDTTAAAPSYKEHRDSDLILGEGLGLITSLPRVLSLWLGALMMRCNPSDPLVSPLFGDLSNLAPTQIHASSNEMLLGDALRYTSKARAAGSPVQLQIWENQLHDWHLFNMGSSAANSAWQEVDRFIRSL
ncbi:MAG: alpha/beta hydrolase [Gammaproteobacteria bacterium]|nr:alpha/beta hydrolase [Gammaproteobacteria bacterium]